MSNQNNGGDVPLVEQLIRRNIEQIETRYLRAVTRGIESPVVAIVDLRDRIGGAVADWNRNSQHRRRVLRLLAEHEADPEDAGVPWNILVSDRWSVLAAWERATPNGDHTIISYGETLVPEGLAGDPPDGHFFVLSVVRAGDRSHVWLAALPVPE